MGWVGNREAGGVVTWIWIGMIVVPIVGYIIYAIVTYKPTEIVTGSQLPPPRPSSSAK
jgi:hypothetical protein